MLPILRRVLSVVVALVSLVPSAVLAQASKAGTVTTLEGTVTVTTASLPQPRPLKFKDDVFVDDRIVTGDRSIARMLLGGKAVVTVRERSSLTITEVPGKSTIALDRGKIAVAVAREKMRPGEELEVRTPNAVAGVRGTVFITEVSQATASLDSAQGSVTSSFYGFAGAVTIRTGSRTVALNPGMYLSATGFAPAISGLMTDAMRALALAGLQPGLKLATGATQELANEQAMGTTVATFTGSAAAVGSAEPPSPPPPAVSMTPPLLPGGIERIPPPGGVSVAATSGQSAPSAFLLFGDRANERAALAAQITSDFPRRVMVDVAGLPSDLSAFGTAWHVGALVPATEAQQTTLRTFLAAGGGLHLTGERPCCETLNASITTFVRSMVEGGAGITVGGQGDITGPFTFNPGDRVGLGRRLLAAGVTQFTPTSPGGIVGVSAPNVLVSAASGTVVGAVWGENDLVGDGRLTLLMDVNWLLNAGAPLLVRSVNAFITDDVPSTLRLSGPLFRSLGDDLGEAGDHFLDVAGYTIIGSSAEALIALSGSRLDLPGSLSRLTESTVANAGSLVRVDGGAEIVQRGTEPLVGVSGGLLEVGGDLFDIAGRPEAVAVDGATGLVLGTDRPIQPGPGAPLFQAENAAVVRAAGSAFKIDTAVLEATAPLLALNGRSALTTGGDAIALVKQARLEIPSDAVALVSLRGGVLSVANGSLVNVAGGSRLGVAGSLVSLASGSTMNIFNGALLGVSGGSVVNIGGALVSFSGAGNVLNVTNSFIPTALIAGIPVHGPAASFTIAGTPLAGLGTAGSININGVALTPTTPLSSLNGSLIAIQGSGTVKVGP